MRISLPFAAAFLFVSMALSAHAQPTRENLTPKKSRATQLRESKEVEREARIPKFEFKQSYYNRTNRTPDLYQSVATILTKDVRVFRDWLITDVVWDYETGNMLCLQAEPPSTKGLSEIFYASEIRSITTTVKSGQRRYYVFDDKKNALRPAMRGIYIDKELVARYALDRKKRRTKFGDRAVERIQPSKEEVARCGLERVEIRFKE